MDLIKPNPQIGDNKELAPLSKHDPLGQAALAYQQGRIDAQIQVLSDVATTDVLPVAWLFRSYDQMPSWEQAAIDTCVGRVLDIGAGVGSHSLILQSRGHEVCALDVSTGAVEVMRDRGLKRVEHLSCWDFPAEEFDTILLMMNGIGLVGYLKGLNSFLKLAPQWLAPGGQILLDSSDIRYLYEQEADWALPQDRYYGIVQYQMSYQRIQGMPFDWLYLERDRLAKHARMFGFQCEILQQGPHHEYLARLRWKN